MIEITWKLFYIQPKDVLSISNPMIARKGYYEFIEEGFW